MAAVSSEGKVTSAAARGRSTSNDQEGGLLPFTIAPYQHAQGDGGLAYPEEMVQKTPIANRII
jgi:hypothetical protein